MDNEARKTGLEQKIERGQQARVALSFFDEFEADQKEKLWTAAQKNDSQLITALGYIALTAGAFKSYLQAAVSDGQVAERDLQMEEIQNG